MNSLARRFTNAIQWNIGISVSTVIVQLGITAIVARLLTPFDFGLFAIANVAFVIASHIGGIGLISAIVREPVLDRKIIGSAVLLSYGLSAVLALTCIVLAPLATTGPDAVGKRTVEGLLRLMSLAIVISGVGAPAQAMMQRDLHFRELALTQFTGLILGTGATTVVLALLQGGPWSLAYGYIVNMAIVTGGCWWEMRHQWSIFWRPDHIMRIGRISIQMTVLRVLDSLWAQMPLIVANSQLSSYDVGLYQRAQSLVDMGFQSTCGRVNNVLFPVMASRQHQEGFLRELIPPLIGIYSLFLLPAAAFVAVAAPDIVALMLGPRWGNATGPLVVIMIAYTSLFISQSASSQLEARAMFKARIIGAGVGLIILTIGGLLLVTKYGVIGIAVSAVVSGAVTTAINFFSISDDIQISTRQILGWMIPSAATASLLALTMFLCSHLIIPRSASPAMRLTIMGAVAGGVAVIGFRIFIGSTRRRVLSMYFSSAPTSSAILVLKILGLDRRDVSVESSLARGNGSAVRPRWLIASTLIRPHPSRRSMRSLRGRSGSQIDDARFDKSRWHKVLARWRQYP
jgi:O-antigen/teichoic acid export membrane protein